MSTGLCIINTEIHQMFVSTGTFAERPASFALSRFEDLALEIICALPELADSLKNSF